MKKLSRTLAVVCILCLSMVQVSCRDKVQADYRGVDEVILGQGDVQEKLPELKFDNFELPDRIMTVETDKLYTFTSKVVPKDKDYTTDEQKSYLKALVQSFVGGYDEANFFADAYSYSYSDDHCAAFISPIGSFGVVKRELTPDDEEEIEAEEPATVETEKVIHADRGESTDVTYKVGGKELPLGDAIAMAEDAWKLAGFKEYLRDDEDYRLKYILIKKYTWSEEVEYTYDLYYSILKNGVPLVETGGNPSNDGYPFNTYAVVSFTEKPEVTQIRLECYVDTSGAKEYTDKLITLENALELASDYLAEYHKYTVPEIGMVYCAIAAGLNYETLDYRPMWRITLEEDQQNCLSRQPVLALYVDMTNGDMYLFNDLTAEMLGIKKGDE